MAFSASERFTLVDTDGELLASPGDELDIIEPIGFGEFINNIKADEEYFGFNAEFGEAESELGFDWNKAAGATYSGQEFITWFVDNIGIDANVSLRYYRTSGGTETLDYEWALILKSTDEIDAPIRVRVKKEDFGDKLRTRFDTDIDVESDVDLDDNGDSGLTLIELPLHSRLTRLSVDADVNADPQEIGTNRGFLAIFDTFQVYGTVGFATINLNELGFINTNVNLSETSVVDNELNILTTPYKGDYTFDVELTATYRQNEDSSDPIGNYSLDFYLLILDSSDNEKFNESLFSTSGNESGDDLTINVSIDYENTFALEAGDRIFIYSLYDSSTASGTELTFQETAGSLIITGDTKYPPSTTTGHFIYDVLKKAVNKAIGNQDNTKQIIGYTKLGGSSIVAGYTLTGQTSGAVGTVDSVAGGFATVTLSDVNTVFEDNEGITWPDGGGGAGIVTSVSYPETSIESDLIKKTDDGAATDGYASLNFVTSGKKIRGLTSNANLKVSPSKLIDFLRCRWAAGWQIVDDSGTKHIKVDKNWEFMEAVKILTLYNVENPVRRQFNTENIYNKSEVGYTKFAKENEDGSIDGFNTKQNRLHPIQKEKRKFPLVAPVVTDGAEIERVRRLKIKEDESDQSDDEILMIKCQRISSSIPLKSSDVDEFSFAAGYFAVKFSTDDTITLYGLYLKGQADNATKLFIKTGASFVEYDINSISFDASNNRMVISVAQNITSTTSVTSYELYFDINVFMPEKKASFLSISGITDEYSEYNIDQAPSNFLIQWWHILGGAVTQKAGTKKVKFTSGQNTVSLSKRYRTTDGNLTTSQITEGQDFLLSSLNIYNPPIITPFVWELTCYLTYEDWQLLRKALLGQNEDSPSKNWGYVEFPDNFGNLVQIWPRTLKRTEKSGKVEIFGWERNTATPPPPPTFFRLLETGDYRLLETGDRRLLEN